MSSLSGTAMARGPERNLLIEEFEKDVKFLQVFMLLINRSCPIRNVDLVWAESGPAGRSGWRHMGTVEALGGPCSRMLHCSPGNPHPRFCNIINDHGLREAESCAASDGAAEQRVSLTGRAEVYRCHFGLIDIAIPVISNGVQIATLFSGQVLNAAPTEEGFAQIVKDVAHLPWVSVPELREAYWNSAVVSDEDIRNTVGILEVFAEYLASSWERLHKAVQQERQHARELEIRRKEFAYLVLGGSPAEMPYARAALDRLGQRTCPNRALVAQWETADGPQSVESDREVTTVLHTIDDICERVNNVVHAYIRGRGVCIFIHEPPRARRHARSNARELAQTILHAVAERTPLRVRIGIGEIKADFARLGESYHEANVALTATPAAIAFFSASSEPEGEVTALTAQIPDLLKERRFEEARLALHWLPFHVQRQYGANLPASRRVLLSVVGAMLAAVPRLGFDASLAARLRTEAGESLARAGTAFDLQEAYVRLGESILDELRQMHLDKGSRLVNRAYRLIERSIDEGTPMTQSSLARALGISPSHLSRVFRQTTGDTFERYVVRRRLDLARRLLLDPAHNVSTVALQCGFNDASYFARVFRRTVGCSPTEYSRRPTREPQRTSNSPRSGRSSEERPTSAVTVPASTTDLEWRL